MAAPPARELVGLPLRGLLDALAEESPVPGAGAAAAAAAAMAAALVTMCARASGEWVEAPGIAAQAQALRARLVALVETSVAAYEGALVALGAGDGGTEWHDLELGSALVHAAEAPLAVADAAADVAELSVEAAVHGEPSLRADAAAAAILAHAAARIATQLVTVNLAAGASAERRQRAERAERVAREAADRVLAFAE